MIRTCIAALLILSFLTNDSYAQSPNWQWVRSEGETQYDQGSSVCCDRNGNIIVVGRYFDDSIVFGSYTLINHSNGSGDFFVVKYDGYGNIEWAKNGGGQANNAATGICTDFNGNIYVTGYFNSPTLILGTDTLFNTDISIYDVFIAKYDSLGNIMWAQSAKGGSTNVPSGITCDINGNLYVSGYFENDTIDFGTIKLHNDATITAFLVKYDANGNVIWAKNSVGKCTSVAKCVATDPTGNVYIAGGFTASGFSDSLAFGNIVQVDSVNGGFFVTKYNAAGDVLWVKTASGPGVTTISIDADGNPYFAGFFDFDSIVFSGMVAINSSGGLNHLFVAKCDSSGNPIWIKSPGGAGVSPYFMNNTSDGGLLITGEFSDTLILGNTVLVRGNTDTFNFTNLFVAKFDLSGNVEWAKSTSGNGYNGGQGICSDPSGNNIYVTGTLTSGSLAFDSITITMDSGVASVFLAKIFDYSTGIIPINNRSSEITVYPNPSNGTFYFNGVNEGSTIDIYDIMGQHVYTAEVYQNSYSVDLSPNSKGIYFYKVTDGNNNAQQGKIILE